MQTSKPTFWEKVWTWIEALDYSAHDYHLERCRNTEQELKTLRKRVRELELEVSMVTVGGSD